MSGSPLRRVAGRLPRPGEVFGGLHALHDHGQAERAAELGDRGHERAPARGVELQDRAVDLEQVALAGHGGAPVLHGAAGLPQHDAADLHDRAGLLGDRHEHVGVHGDVGVAQQVFGGLPAVPVRDADARADPHLVPRRPRPRRRGRRRATRTGSSCDA